MDEAVGLALGSRVARPARLRRLGAFAGCLLALAAQANVFVEDRRQQQDAAQPPWRSVGVLRDSRSGAGGTAFLVGNCHVVSAQHVARPKGRTGQVIEFFIGADPTRPRRFASRSRARVVAAGRFSSRDYEGMAGDWAVLRLDSCLGRRYGFLRLARVPAQDPMPQGDLAVAGFPHSRAHLPGITVERGCKARDHGPVSGLVGVDCAFESGMSGGPILEYQPGRGWRVVGLVQQSLGSVTGILEDYSMVHRNQMLSVSAFRPAVEQVLREEAWRALPQRVPGRRPT
jgi:Trypsin-like peptidase domain